MTTQIEALLIRWGVIIALGAALFGFGWLQGVHHEQTKAASFQGGVEAVGKSAAAHKATVEGLQGKVVENVTTQVKSATAASDAYWLRHARSDSRAMSSVTAPAAGTQPSATAGTIDTARCTEADGAADALQIHGLQDFYNGLIQARQ